MVRGGEKPTERTVGKECRHWGAQRDRYQTYSEFRATSRKAALGLTKRTPTNFQERDCKEIRRDLNHAFALGTAKTTDKRSQLTCFAMLEC
jgi:hypothetical protein